MYILALQEEKVNEPSTIRISILLPKLNKTIAFCSQTITKIHVNPESGFQAISNS